MCFKINNYYDGKLVSNRKYFNNLLVEEKFFNSENRMWKKDLYEYNSSGNIIKYIEYNLKKNNITEFKCSYDNNLLIKIVKWNKSNAKNKKTYTFKYRFF